MIIRSQLICKLTLRHSLKAQTIKPKTMPTFQCKCGQSYSVKEEMLGRIVQCKKCGRKFKTQLRRSFTKQQGPTQSTSEEATEKPLIQKAVDLAITHKPWAIGIGLLIAVVGICFFALLWRDVDENVADRTQQPPGVEEGSFIEGYEKRREKRLEVKIEKAKQSLIATAMENWRIIQSDFKRYKFYDETNPKYYMNSIFPKNDVEKLFLLKLMQDTDVDQKLTAATSSDDSFERIKHLPAFQEAYEVCASELKLFRESRSSE